MIKLFTSSSSVQHRFLLVALIPLLTTTGLLTFYSIKARQTDALSELHHSGNNAASYFAAAADFPLYSGNRHILEELAKSIAELNHVSSAVFLDRDHQPVASSGAFPMPTASLSELPEKQPFEDEYLYFKHPVYISGVTITDYDEQPEGTSEETTEPIGWVLLAMDQSGIQAKNQEILMTSIRLAMIGGISAIILTYLLSRAILKPIHNLTNTVRKLESGRLDSRATIYTQDELSILAKGINQLAQTVADNRDNLQQQIKDATYELEASLESLQRKNRELEVARESAEKANQAKSDFLARMSHELRTPITAIQGFVRLLTEMARTEADRHYCHIINQAASQLLTLIDDILVFSKLQSNTVSLEKNPINLAECVENVAALFSTAAQEKSLDLLVDIDPKLRLSRIGDSARLSQIINNLVSNAIKFTGDGGVFITLKPNSQSPFSHVDICVQDTGIGIAKDSRDQIFHAFAQADTSISRHYGGTGLGLSIVKNLVDLMGGSINMESERGSGTHFCISLPLPCQREEIVWESRHYNIAICADSTEKARSIVHALSRFGCDTEIFQKQEDIPTRGHDAIILCLSPACLHGASFPDSIMALRNRTSAKLILLTPVISLSELFTTDELKALQPATFIANPATLFNIHQALAKIEDSEPETWQETPKTPLQNLNILIAEDNDFTGLLLETLISKSGGHCALATNGIEAVKASQQEKFDIMLIDVHMPELSGIDAISEIRRGNSINAQTPIIALTADILQQDEEALKQAGANDLLFKPLNENFLLERIRTAAGLHTRINAPVEITSEDISPEAFYEEINRLVDEITKARDSGDTQKMRDFSHQLIGVAGVFKLEVLDKKACALHSAIKLGEPNLISQKLEILKREASNLCQPA